jgi:hypothetical protein
MPLRTLRATTLLLAMAGCARVPPADLSRDPAALLEQVQQAQARVKAVRGSARVRISSPDLSGTVTEFVAAAKPDRVHLETLDFFGNPAAVLVAAGGRFAFFDGRAKVYYRGDATPENISRLLPVVLPVEELVTILCGSAPLLPGRPVEVGTDDGLVLLTLAQGDVGQRVALGERATVRWSRIRRAAREPGGKEEAPAYDLEFGAFEELGGAPFPAEVRLDAPSARSRVDLRWLDLELDPRLEARLFRLEPPRGARVVDLAPGAAIPPYELPVGGPRE